MYNILIEFGIPMELVRLKQILCSNDRASLISKQRRDQLDATISDFIGNQMFLNMFRASLHLSSGGQTAFHCLWFSVLL